MGKKYIVELEDNKLAYTAIIIDGVPYIKLLQLLPYTEPDLEQVRKKAYQSGYETAKHECEDCTKPLDNGKAYQHGLNDAWEATKWLAKANAGVNFKVFGMHFTREIVHNLTASECIEKIRQYEQEQEEIKVGDEVEIDCPDLFAIYMGGVDGNENAVYLLFDDGSCGIHVRSEIKRKTGRYFPEIVEVLQKMKKS